MDDGLPRRTRAAPRRIGLVQRGPRRTRVPRHRRTPSRRLDLPAGVGARRLPSVRTRRHPRDDRRLSTRSRPARSRRDEIRPEQGEQDVVARGARPVSGGSWGHCAPFGCRRLARLPTFPTDRARRSDEVHERPRRPERQSSGPHRTCGRCGRREPRWSRRARDVWWCTATARSPSAPRSSTGDRAAGTVTAISAGPCPAGWRPAWCAAGTASSRCSSGSCSPHPSSHPCPRAALPWSTDLDHDAQQLVPPLTSVVAVTVAGTQRRPTGTLRGSMAR